MFIYKTPNKNYSIHSNEIMRDESLSVEARFLYCLLVGYGVQWRFNPKHIAAKMCMSVKTLYKYMKELYDRELLIRVQSREDDGRYANETTYIFTHDISVEELEINLKELDKNQIKDLHNTLNDAIERSEPNSISFDFETELFGGGDITSFDTDILENERLQNVEATNDQDSDKVAEVKKAELPKFTRHINNGVYNNTQNVSDSFDKGKNKKNVYALINLFDLNEQCIKALQNYKIKQGLKQEAKKSNYTNFLNSLTPEQKEAYQRFIAYRQSELNQGIQNKQISNKKLKETTLRAIQRSFKKLIDKGQNMGQVVENSINHGWSGLFEIKEFKKDSISFKKPRNVFKSQNKDPLTLEQVEANKRLKETLNIDINAEWQRIISLVD